MTENKRYTCDIHRILDNEEQLACADTMDDAEIIVDILSQQDEEIQRLKAQLEHGEDVCRICKHTYLVPSGKYYIAQCKKGHSGCSKGTVDYCDDFELKDSDSE